MNILIFILSLAICFGLPTLLGAPYTAYSKEWYRNLKRPSFALPDIVFIVIFPLFYFVESVGLYLILINQNIQNLYLYIGLFFLSAILSGLWSRLFFIHKRCDYSLVAFFTEIPVTILFVFLLAQESHTAWLFFVPRILWGLYAIFVNVELYRLNKTFWKNAK